MSTTDRIEKSIRIEAPAERVWALIAEPGWYINDGMIVEHRIDRDGDMSTVHDPVHGAFLFRTVRLEPPRYAAFRWIADADDPDKGSTLVEFRIEDEADGAVRLHLAESGFDSLPGGAVARRRRFDENSTGWDTELEAARVTTEGSADGGGTA